MTRIPRSRRAPAVALALTGMTLLASGCAAASEAVTVTSQGGPAPTSIAFVEPFPATADTPRAAPLAERDGGLDDAILASQPTRILRISGAGVPSPSLADGKALWTRAGITSYGVAYTVSCEIPCIMTGSTTEVRGHVQDGEVDSLPTEVPPPGGVLDIDGLFEALEQGVWPDTGHTLEITLHETRGYPTSIRSTDGRIADGTTLEHLVEVIPD